MLQVSVVWLMDTVHQALIIHSAYIYLITNYGNPEALAVVTRSLSVRRLHPVWNPKIDFVSGNDLVQRK